MAIVTNNFWQVYCFGKRAIFSCHVRSFFATFTLKCSKKDCYLLNSRCEKFSVNVKFIDIKSFVLRVYGILFHDFSPLPSIVTFSSLFLQMMSSEEGSHLLSDSGEMSFLLSSSLFLKSTVLLLYSSFTRFFYFTLDY